MKFDCPVWPPTWPEIETAVAKSLQSGDWGRYQSPAKNDVRQRICAQFSVAHSRLCGSGTAAVQLALKAAGVKMGTEVIVAAYDYTGNFRCIELCGGRPVLVDTAETGCSLDPEFLDDADSKDVVAVLVSHLYGCPAQIAELREYCDSRRWVLIEDACQVPGMLIHGKPAGSYGHMSTLSFGGSKPLTAGNGGAILTNESRFAAKIDSLVDCPSDSQPLSSLQAAVLGPQFDRLERCNQMRAATVQYLRSEVAARLPGWSWLDEIVDDDFVASHYKLAFVADSNSHRQKMISKAPDFGLPIGEGFRSMHKSSDRRCRKASFLERSAQYGEELFVLDHSALLIEPERHSELGAALVALANH